MVRNTLLCLLIGITLPLGAQVSQIDINRIEMMPNEPSQFLFGTGRRWLCYMTLLYMTSKRPVYIYH